MKENRETFFRRLPGLSIKDRFALEFAYDIAKEAHGYIKQTRDGGERYFNHVRAVALILIDEFGITDINILIPALFHDMPEDVPIWKTPGRIGMVFGNEIERRSHMLAKPDKEKFDSKQDQLLFYFKQLVKDWRVCLIKIADRIHNESTMESGKWDEERISRYHLETDTYFPTLIEAIAKEDSNLARRASNLLFKQRKTSLS